MFPSYFPIKLRVTIRNEIIDKYLEEKEMFYAKWRVYAVSLNDGYVDRMPKQRIRVIGRM
jgi:hypothetical protein